MFTYSFSGKVWKYAGNGGWHFVTLPKVVSKKIRSAHGKSEEGWGRLKTIALLGKSKWKTSIWYDTKADGYLMPIKSDVRKKEKIVAGKLVGVKLVFKVEEVHSSNLGSWLVNR